MIHIVFNEADVKILEQVIALDTSLEGKVLQIKDDFAVGPIEFRFDEAAQQNRKEWWNQVLQGGDYEYLIEKNEVDDNATLNTIIEALKNNEEEVLWIWCAQNKHDVSGYYWLVSQLKEWQGSVYILYLNNLPFINEKGQIFYPEWIQQIQPSEFLKAKKLARLITSSEFEVDPDEWQKLCNENKSVRILEGGKKLIQDDYHFYEKELMTFITNDFQKASKIVHQYLTKSKHTTGDAFLLWLLKQMIANNKIIAQGNIAKSKDFEVKANNVAAQEIE
jgi:hypothetical protein